MNPIVYAQRRLFRSHLRLFVAKELQNGVQTKSTFALTEDAFPFLLGNHNDQGCQRAYATFRRSLSAKRQSSKQCSSAIEFEMVQAAVGSLNDHETSDSS